MIPFFVLLSVVFCQDPAASVNILSVGDLATNGETTQYSRIEFIIDWTHLGTIPDGQPDDAAEFVSFEALSLLVKDPDNPHLPGEEVMSGDGICPLVWTYWKSGNQLVIYNDWTSDTIMTDCVDYFNRAPEFDNGGYAYLQDVHKLFSLVVRDPIDIAKPIIFRENYRFSALIPEDFEGHVQIAVYSYEAVVDPFKEYVVKWEHQISDTGVDQENVLELGREETYILTLSALGLYFDELDNCDFYLRKSSETDETDQVDLKGVTGLWDNSIAGQLTVSFTIDLNLYNYGTYGYIFLRSGIMDPDPVVPRREMDVAESSRRILIIKRETGAYNIVITILGVSIAASLLVVCLLASVLVGCFVVKRKQNKFNSQA